MSADTTPTNSPRTQRVDSLMTSRSMPHIMHDYSVDGMITTLCNGDVAPSNDTVQRYFSVYHYYVSDIELLQLLMERFHVPKNASGIKENDDKRITIQLRVVNAIKKWLELRYSELVINEEWMELYNIFLNTINKNEIQKQWSAFLMKRFDEISRLMTPTVSPLAGASANQLNSPYSILKAKPAHIAEQMTYHESALFRQIPLVAYSASFWSNSPPAHSFSERFNKTSYWVASEVMMRKSRKERVMMIVFFIKVLQHLVKINNFNGAMEVLSAFNLHIVTTPAMQNDWKAVPSKYMALLKEASNLMNPRQNYGSYRELLKTVKAPCIPFVSLVLRDVIHVEEQEETFVEGVVNNEKMSRISRIYSEVIKYLPPEDGYAFSEDLNVTRYLFYRYQYALTEQDLSAQLEASLSASTAGLDDSGSFEASSSSPKKPKRSRSLQNLTPEAGKEPQVNLRGSESVEFVVSPTSREVQKLYQSVLVNNHNKAKKSSDSSESSTNESSESKPKKNKLKDSKTLNRTDSAAKRETGLPVRRKSFFFPERPSMKTDSRKQLELSEDVKTMIQTPTQWLVFDKEKDKKASADSSESEKSSS